MKAKNTLLFILCGCLPILSWAQPASHDPSNIVKDGDRYWAFHTGNGIHATSASDPSFKDWRDEGAVFPKKTFPSWIKTYVSEFGGHFWAPDVIYMNGKWHLYYSCSTFGSRNSAIGLVTANSLNNKDWEDKGMVTFTTEASPRNAIDPDVFRDKDGEYWMTWGSFWNGIVVARIDSVTGKLESPDEITYVANDHCEAPAIIYKEDYYYLFFNRGYCCRGINSTYQIFVGRATHPAGPYLDKDGNDCNRGGGTSFLSTDGQYIGPGHFGLYGEDVFSYHYYDGRDEGKSKMKVARLKWENGWPVAD